jgi:hypothetical protein
VNAIGALGWDQPLGKNENIDLAMVLLRQVDRKPNVQAVGQLEIETKECNNNLIINSGECV